MRKFHVVLCFFSLILGIILYACSAKAPEKQEVKVISISRASGGKSYSQYIKRFESLNKNFKYIDLYTLSLDSALSILEISSGLVLSGGADVCPSRYNKIEDTVRCDINLKRDTLEFALIEKAMELNMPVLAICRGMQIVNVAMGGDLIVDIPEDYKSIIKHKCNDSDSCFHNVQVEKQSLLYEISKVISGQVNTNHHQALGKLSEKFRVIAFSNDSIAEAIQWKDCRGNAFFLGVQWHPERMDKEHPLSKPLLIKFLEEAMIYSYRNKE